MKLCIIEKTTRPRARVRQDAASRRPEVLPIRVLILLFLVLTAAACETAYGTPPASRPTPAVTAATSVPAARATAAQTSTRTLPSEAPTALPTDSDNDKSNIEEAHERFRNEGHDTVLILVDGTATGIEREIYEDLTRRNFRATTGPDEGIDTSSLPCYPNCLFVVREEANASSVEGWLGVLRHEYRHIVQARNNPNMAKDFRDRNGRFTPYAAFCEVCADYGLNVAADYRAQERMDELRSVLGGERQALIDRACDGDKAAFEDLVKQFNDRRGSLEAFAQLFPPYD